MLIRTQNKTCLTLLENIDCICIEETATHKYRVKAQYNDGSLYLGTYGTWDACKEVLENIYYCYGNKCICYQMPEVIEDE